MLGPAPHLLSQDPWGHLRACGLQNCLMHTKACGALWQVLRDALMETEKLRVRGGERLL